MNRPDVFCPVCNERCGKLIFIEVHFYGGGVSSWECNE